MLIHQCDCSELDQVRNITVTFVTFIKTETFGKQELASCCLFKKYVRIFVCSERSLPKTFNEKLSLELKRPSFPSWVKQTQYVFEISWSEITGIKCLEYLDPKCKIMGENGCIIWGGKIFRVLKLSQTRKLFPARPHSTACASGRSGPFPAWTSSAFGCFDILPKDKTKT